MPIRMTDDPDEGRHEPDEERPRRRGGSGGGSGSGGGLGGLLALVALLRFAFRHPILSLVVLAVGGALYLFSGAAGAPASGEGYGTGAKLDPKVYDEALVYEPLAKEESGRLPDRISLLAFAPRRRSQGSQGSCVGWASSYAARTILAARETGARPDEIAFSPSFLYNQIAKEGCGGSYLVRAMEVLERTGDLPLSDFEYDEDSCDDRPSDAQLRRAAQFRIRGFTRLSIDSGDYRNNAEAIKEHLAKGAPVVIGMHVGGTFEGPMNGRRVWHPTKADYAEVGDWGGHAMAVIGYDDLLEGGAFQLMNSWGDDWGEGGVAWVRYEDFDHFVKEAYGLYPAGEARAAGGAQTVRFGLVEHGSHRRIALRQVEGPVFRTARPLRKGARFKVEFSNTRPCYTYLFGQESDGSSYVLFPYTPKHSPYCGTTGTRIFPRRQSLTADDVGTRDHVAVVISPGPLDFAALNARVSAQRGGSYGAKLRAALGAQLSDRARYDEEDELVRLVSSETDDAKVHALVLEFDKR